MGEEEGGRTTAAVRLAIGLVQGVALYLLYSAADAKTWPATDGLVFAPMLLVSLYIPLVLLVSIGNLRLVTIAAWTLLASAVVGFVAWYGVWHWPMDWNDKPAIAPSASVFAFTLGALFIGQALVAGGDHDRRFIAHYATHFDVAWKLGLQGLLSGVFVGIFWAVLELGAALFNLIGLSGFGHF